MPLLAEVCEWVRLHCRGVGSVLPVGASAMVDRGGVAVHTGAVKPPSERVRRAPSTFDYRSPVTLAEELTAIVCQAVLVGFASLIVVAFFVSFTDGDGPSAWPVFLVGALVGAAYQLGRGNPYPKRTTPPS